MARHRMEKVDQNGGRGDLRDMFNKRVSGGTVSP